MIRDKEQEKVLSARQNQIANQSPDRMDELVLQPGVKDFDPKMDQTQLFDAAKEFERITTTVTVFRITWRSWCWIPCCSR